MALADFGTGSGHILDGYKVEPLLGAGGEVVCRGLSEAGNGNEGCPQLVLANRQELCGIGLEKIYGGKLSPRI